MNKKSKIPDWWASLPESMQKAYLKSHPQSKLPIVPQIPIPVTYTGQLPRWVRDEVNSLRGPYASIVTGVIKSNIGKTFNSRREMYKTIGHQIRRKLCRKFLDVIKQADQSYDLNVTDKKQLHATIQRLEKYYDNNRLKLFKDAVVEQAQSFVEGKLKIITESFIFKDFVRLYKAFSKIIKIRNRLNNKHVALIHKEFVKYALSDE